MTLFPSQHRLRPLLTALRENQLTAEQAEQLNNCLRDDIDARRVYARYAVLQSCLELEWGPPSVVPQSEPFDAITRINSLPLRSLSASSWMPANRAKILTWAFAIVTNAALVFILALAVSPHLRQHVWGSKTIPTPMVESNTPGPTEPIARLIAATDCVWRSDRRKSPAIDGSEPRVGDALQAGALALLHGSAEMQFVSGTRVTMIGPCEFELESLSKTFLSSGKLMARVPHRAAGFTVGTPAANVVDLGTEFGVEVTNSGATDVQVIRGEVEVTRKSVLDQTAQRSTRVTTGRAVRVTVEQPTISNISYDEARFSRKSEQVAKSGLAEADSDLQFAGPIWLGNLFDDPAGTRLADAVATDTFQATADIDDLGIDRVLYNYDAIKKITRNITFDLSKLGWGEYQTPPHANVTNDDAGTFGGIRTKGIKLENNRVKLEEGIGMLVDAMLTFDLEEIRAAGGLQGKALLFVCDRAGVNDVAVGGGPQLNLTVIASTARDIHSVLVNGQPVEVAKQEGVWSIVSAIEKPLRDDGRFVEFRVPLPADVRYLTLVATSAARTGWFGNAAWSGARLEVLK